MTKATCVIPGCIKPSLKKLMCNAHYLKAWKYGDPLHVAKPKRRACEIANCDRAPRSESAGICEMHYYRNRRHGDPLAVRVPTGRAETSNGYALIHRPTHPLARQRGHAGWALEHRVVLFDHIGPGWHPCHWCGTSVAWHRQYPRDLDALVVDHVDGDKANNARSNLVPSCYACNLARGQEGGTRDDRPAHRDRTHH